MGLRLGICKAKLQHASVHAKAMNGTHHARLVGLQNPLAHMESEAGCGLEGEFGELRC